MSQAPDICEGCGQKLIICDADWWLDQRPCCTTCTHIRAHPKPIQVEG